MTPADFKAKLTSALKASPPKLKDGFLDEDSFGDWVAANMTLEELEIFMEFEAHFGDKASAALVTEAFVGAGLPAPKYELP